MASFGKKMMAPPAMTEDFDLWLRELEIWQCVTDLEVKKRGPAVYLSLDQKTRNRCLDIAVEELNSETGIDILIRKLKQLYAKDVNQQAFITYENFEKFSRPRSMSVTDYINEFERLNYKLKSCKMDLPDGVLAYRVLKSANITEEKEQLARATIHELTYENMKKQLKAIFQHTATAEDTYMKQEMTDAIKVEESYYASNDRRTSRWQRPNYSRRRGGGTNPRWKGAGQRGNARRTNPVDDYGNTSKCAICQSIFHWARDCPDSYESRKLNEEKVTLFSSGVEEVYLQQFLGETFNYGILDCGCTQNVCGTTWMNCYLSTLDDDETSQVTETESGMVFRFGSGPSIQSTKCVKFPIYIGSEQILIESEVVDCDLPLLLSKNWMKDKGSKLDFSTDSISILGNDIKLHFTTSGHYAIPIMKPKVLLYSECPLSNKTEQEKHDIVKKLHKQFGHPAGEKLLKLVKDAGMKDQDFFKMLKNFESECDICVQYKKPALRPVVGISLSKEFNDTVSMDLKFIDGKPFLHMIDHATRFSAGAFVKSKEKEEIIDIIFKHWISIFGVPLKFLTDNGGEFNNSCFRDMADNLNITVLTTAAEAPWSNGITERHNAIIGNMMEKIIADTNCSMEVGLAWALSAKNALQNVYGYSPNQLVFGQNPNTPCVWTDSLPALEGKTNSERIAEHLNALHASRKAFISCESNEKIRRALRHQVRPSTGLIYQNGDTVFYKRNQSNKWCGPGVVIGKDNQQVFVRHGGTYVRVHPCMLRHDTRNKTQSSDVKDNTDDETTHSSDWHSSIKKLVEFDTPVNSSDVLGEQCTSRPTQNSDRDDEHLAKSFPVKGHKILTKEEETDWREAIVISRAGKSTGKNRHWVNVKDCSDDSLKSVNLDVIEWKPVENVLISKIESKSRSLEVSEAKINEIGNWKEHDVFSEVCDDGQNCISVRWVITEKTKDGVSIIKARLVARGFEEQSGSIRKDSPTCCRENIRLILTLISTFNWRLNSLDVKSAFLQGGNIDRDIFLKPPPEAGTDKLWKLKTTVYGLCDAPRVWYLRIKDELLNCGAQVSSYDEAIFYWSFDGTLQGVICCHVDDFCWGGTEVFQESVINVIRSKFLISSEECDVFHYVGLNLKQINDEIQMSQDEYINEIEPMNIDKTNRTKSDPISIAEARQLRGLVGQLNWTANQTRPDISFDACEVSVSQKNGTLEDLLRANKSIRKLKCESFHLKFPNLGNIHKICLLAYSDASFANLKGGGSQGGYIVFLVGNIGKAALINWQSKKIRRVVKSTIAAESLALLEAAEACCLLRVVICEILSIETCSVPIHCVVDNRSLCDTVYSTKTLSDKRLKIDICVLRDMLSKGEIQNIEWTDSQSQLADCLTKSGASSSNLFHFLYTQDIWCKYCKKN